MTMTTGPNATGRQPAHASDAGNLSISHKGKAEAAALAQNDGVNLCIVPKGSIVHGIKYAHDALGASTALKFGYAPVAVGGMTADDDKFGTISDASTAGAGIKIIESFTATSDIYITVVNTGAGAATGTVEALALYLFDNSVD